MNEASIQGLALDSRRVNPGDLFFAVPGTHQEGSRYIEEAIQKGAVAILKDASLDWVGQSDQAKKIPVVSVPNLKNMIGPIAGRFYDNPTQKLKVVGITGTNGKTTCAHFIAQLLEKVDLESVNLEKVNLEKVSLEKVNLQKVNKDKKTKVCGFIGTLGYGFLDQTFSLFGLTTPDPISLQKMMFEFWKEGATNVTLEVTSHALDQGRVEGTHFHTAIFTNLTRDHLDYHPSMDAYFTAKKKLFLDFSPEFSIINLDDPYGRQLVEALPEALKKGNRVYGYTLQPSSPVQDLPTIITTELRFQASGIEARIKTPWGEGNLKAALMGPFNVQNLLASVGALLVQGVPLQTVLEVVPTLVPVPGRMNCLGGKEVTVVIDYAHTPDALSKALAALRLHCKEGKLYCVFGCGGDRDPGKRSLMGQVAEEAADVCVVTSDNPRTEDPTQIIEAILKGFQSKKPYVEPDRAKAIEWAIERADKNDIILIAGKGHEEVQIIGQNKIPFKDGEIAEKIFQKLQLKREAC